MLGMTLESIYLELQKNNNSAGTVYMYGLDQIFW